MQARIKYIASLKVRFSNSSLMFKIKLANIVMKAKPATLKELAIYLSSSVIMPFDISIFICKKQSGKVWDFVRSVTLGYSKDNNMQQF